MKPNENEKGHLYLNLDITCLGLACKAVTAHFCIYFDESDNLVIVQVGRNDTDVNVPENDAKRIRI